MVELHCCPCLLKQREGSHLLSLSFKTTGRKPFVTYRRLEMTYTRCELCVLDIHKSRLLDCKVDLTEESTFAVDIRILEGNELFFFFFTFSIVESCVLIFSSLF